MKHSRMNYFLVGAFTLAMIVGMVLSAAKLMGRSEGINTFHAFYDNVSGLKFGTQVLYEGFPVGQVEGIVIHPEGEKARFRVDLTVSRRVPIPKDSIARIAVSGLLASSTVSIMAGESTDLLAPGSRIASEEPTDVFAMVSSLAKELKGVMGGEGKALVSTAKETILALHGLVTGQGQTVADNLTQVTGDLAKKAPIIIGDLESFSDQLREVANGVESLVNPENVEKFHHAVDDFLEAARQVRALSAELRESRRSMDKLIANADGVIQARGQEVEGAIQELGEVLNSVNGHIDAINLQLEHTSRNMNEFSRRIRQNPGLLLQSNPPEEEEGGGQ